MPSQYQSTGGDALPPAPQLRNARWAFRRALLGLFILVLGVGTMAWLTHASIDYKLEAATLNSP